MLHLFTPKCCPASSMARWQNEAERSSHEKDVRAMVEDGRGSGGPGQAAGALVESPSVLSAPGLSSAGIYMGLRWLCLCLCLCLCLLYISDFYLTFQNLFHSCKMEINTIMLYHLYQNK